MGNGGGRAITRRDFLNGAALAVGAGVAPGALLQAAPRRHYPPVLDGMRGNHPGSFEAAHSVGWGQQSYSTRGLPVEESYDLVVVGRDSGRRPGTTGAGTRGHGS